MADKKEKVGFFGSIKNSFAGFVRNIKDVKSEMKKIVWPSKSQVINNTIIVITVTLISAVFIYGLDTVFGLILKLLLQNV